MSYENLLFEKKEGIAIVTVNRPKVLNALNWKTIEELGEAFGQVKADAEIGAAILTGAGDKAFIAGADIRELTEQTPVTGKANIEKGQAVLNFIENLPKPVIAAVNGYALGGGCETAMACHIRVASKNAKFGQPEVKLGIIPGYAGTQRLPRLVGKGKAMELILTGEMIDADEALRIGLVNKVVESAELMAAAEALARTILKQGPLAVRFAIEAINKGLEMPIEEGIRYEAALLGILFASEDKREGTTAFQEKRAPQFKGR